MIILNENENSELRYMKSKEDENDGDNCSLLDVEKIRKKKRNYNDLDVLSYLYAPLNDDQNNLEIIFI